MGMASQASDSPIEPHPAECICRAATIYRDRVSDRRCYSSESVQPEFLKIGFVVTAAIARAFALDCQPG
ncbi:hypothetical protein LF1_28670 [Rubripirellula obstinata]|uniref:Uncharacterized protein n=1 Tax=Rubripirellula obstinata TaxID=406547 RepID=A0A5B1CGL3_9BACT|nr:hypothetical protein LF1_28670 [Rubripirellula obstinata]